MLQSVYNFFHWFGGITTHCAFFLVSLGGLISMGISGIVGVVSTMFCKFTWLSTATNWVVSATESVRTFVNQDFGVLGEILLGWFSLNSLVQYLTVLVTCTVGATVVVFVTIFAALFVAVPIILSCKAICKAVKTASLGLLEP